MSLSSGSMMGTHDEAVAHRQFYTKNEVFPADSLQNLWKSVSNLGVEMSGDDSKNKLLLPE